MGMEKIIFEKHETNEKKLDNEEREEISLSVVAVELDFEISAQDYKCTAALISHDSIEHSDNGNGSCAELREKI